MSFFFLLVVHSSRLDATIQTTKNRTRVMGQIILQLIVKNLKVHQVRSAAQLIDSFEGIEADEPFAVDEMSQSKPFVLI